MSDIYSRLSGVGFPKKYIRESILPEWWEDDLASYDFNRRVAELAISRTLKIPLDQLADGRSELVLGTGEVRFKRWRDAEDAKLLPAVAVARRVAELLLFCSKELPDVRMERTTAASLRGALLKGAPCVTLNDLLEAAWDLGVPVFHLALLPDRAKRLDGMALLVEGRPCIALASARPSPAWLLWTLGHEIGHIASGHLQAGDILDVDLDFHSEIKDEQEANAYAFSLIYGDAQVDFPPPVHPKKLVAIALKEGKAARILPECLVTRYGFQTGNWPVVQAALKLLHAPNTNGQSQIKKTMLQRVALDRLTEDDRHFVCQVTGLSE
jgi:hypothetical protein